MKKDIMRECMKNYNRMVKRAEEGDEEARNWLISSPRGDSTTERIIYFKSYEDWRAFNGEKTIRRMINDI